MAPCIYKLSCSLHTFKRRCDCSCNADLLRSPRLFGFMRHLKKREVMLPSLGLGFHAIARSVGDHGSRVAGVADLGFRGSVLGALRARKHMGCCCKVKDSWNSFFQSFWF